MIKLVRKTHGINIITVWYAKEKIKDKGIIIYKESNFKIGTGKEFFTLITDLTEDADTIKSHFSKNCKYRVNRSARENIDFVMIDSEHLSDGDIHDFILFFGEFWKSKGTKLDTPEALEKEMIAYKNAGNLTITKALINGTDAVYHTYVNDDNVARSFHSASLFRNSENEEGDMRKVVGIANTALHYQDMLHFKSKGLVKYDWGGAGISEEVASITEFKESFGGTHVTYYDCQQVNGLKAKLIVLLSNIKNRNRN